MKKNMVATAFALTVASPALSDACQTGFSVDRIDFIERQAVLVLSNPYGEEIQIWTNGKDYVDRLGVNDIDFEIQTGTTIEGVDTTKLQQMLSDLTEKTAQAWNELERAPDDINRDQIYSMSYRLNNFNNEDGDTRSPQLEIEIKRGNSITVSFNPYEDSAPLDLSLDDVDIAMLDYLTSDLEGMIDMTQKIIPTQAFVCP